VQLQTRPHRAHYHLGWLPGGGRCVGKVELAADARQGAKHRSVDRTQQTKVASQELGFRRRNLDRGEHA